MQSSQHGHNASTKWHCTDAVGGASPDAVMQHSAPECSCASSKVLEQAPALGLSERQDCQETSIATQPPGADQVITAG